MLQTCQEGMWWEQVDAGCRQLDGQWEPIQASANGCYAASVGICYMEIGLDGLRPLNEEGHRRVLGQLLTPGEMGQVWQLQWRDGEIVFNTNVQNSAAGYQQLEVRAVSQEFQKFRRCRHNLLKVVE